MLQNVSVTVDDEQTLGSILQAQITCRFISSKEDFYQLRHFTGLEWTPQVDFGISPTLQLDGSLLILGSRAGYITLLRYVLVYQTASLQLVQRL